MADFFLSLKTRLHEKHGRKWLVRSFVGMKEQGLLVPVKEQFGAFVSMVERGGKGFSDKQMRGNARGPHFFSILGHDRNNKKVSLL